MQFFLQRNCAWFKNIPKTITDSKLSYFIPINENNGLVMISYTDDNKAVYLKKLSEQNNNEMIEFLVNECKENIWYK